MANNYTVQADQIHEGDTILIAGKLGFAHLTSLIEGEALRKSDQQRLNRGFKAVGKPHTTATITQAEVLYKDPQSPTLSEQYVAERRYASKLHPETGANYSINSKGRQLPIIAIPDGEGHVVQDTSGRELAAGLDVILVLSVYLAKGQTNRGLQLEQVIVREPVRYYAGAAQATVNELAARGIVYAEPPQVQFAGQNAGQPTAGAQPGTVLPNGTQVNADGFALPAPGAIPAAQPQAYAAPVAPAVPVAQPDLTAQLAAAQAENARLAAQAAGQPAQAGSPFGQNPWAGQPTQPNPGIAFQI